MSQLIWKRKNIETKKVAFKLSILGNVYRDLDILVLIIWNGWLGWLCWINFKIDFGNVNMREPWIQILLISREFNQFQQNSIQFINFRTFCWLKCAIKKRENINLYSKNKTHKNQTTCSVHFHAPFKWKTEFLCNQQKRKNIKLKWLHKFVLLSNLWFFSVAVQ